MAVVAALAGGVGEEFGDVAAVGDAGVRIGLAEVVEVPGDGDAFAAGGEIEHEIVGGTGAREVVVDHAEELGGDHSAHPGVGVEGGGGLGAEGGAIGLADGGDGGDEAAVVIVGAGVADQPVPAVVFLGVGAGGGIVSLNRDAAGPWVAAGLGDLGLFGGGVEIAAGADGGAGAGGGVDGFGEGVDVFLFKHGALAALIPLAVEVFGVEAGFG